MPEPADRMEAYELAASAAFQARLDFDAIAGLTAVTDLTP